VSRPTRAAVSLSLLVLCVACDSLERESAYATHADAVADDAILRGWIPPFVPESAREIREIHDLDTNDVCLRFELPVEEHAPFVAPFRKLDPQEIESLPSCGVTPAWWFEGLIQQQPYNDSALYADVYEAAVPRWDDDGALIAVSRTGSTLYIWSR
jgi:hypothetical protein